MIEVFRVMEDNIAGQTLEYELNRIESLHLKTEHHFHKILTVVPEIDNHFRVVTEQIEKKLVLI